MKPSESARGRERELISGMLQGRLTPRDTRNIDPYTFGDETLMRCFVIVEACLDSDAAPVPSRIAAGFEIMGWPTAGVADLIASLSLEA